MKYLTGTIGDTVARVNTEIFLPAIQREFVWKPEQIVRLFDSLLRGYPISTFLFWELADGNQTKWQAYRFITKAAKNGIHNEPAELNGVPKPTLVLDGQQRLTSLLIGLKGSYLVKKKGKWSSSQGAWSEKRLYIDLFKAPVSAEASSEDEASDIYYGLEFLEKAPKPDKDTHWFPVGKILGHRTADEFDAFVEAESSALPDGCSKGQIKTFERNLRRLHDTIWKDDVVAYYTERDQTYDKVLDIFVRANEGGTKLSKSDLLLSMVTAKWQSVDARKAIHDFVDDLNGRHWDGKFTKDFVMKCALSLCDLPVGFKAENFTDANLAVIEKGWEGVKRSLTAAVNLAESFGLDSATLTSQNALIPVAYFVHRNPKADFEEGTTSFEAENAGVIRRWLFTVMINRVFSGSSDNLLKDIRDVLRQLPAGKDFPIDGIAKVATQSGPRKAMKLEEDTIDDLIDNATFGSSQARLALCLIYGGRRWRSDIHQDHIFPRSLFSKKALTAAGYGKDDQEELRAGSDRLANLQILTAKENTEKSKKDFEEWIKTRKDDFMKEHLIPDDKTLWKLKKFREFLTAREDLIREKLKKEFSL
ncbi:MAG: DUF262 domain-containing HNH endonuclease family protein [Phycisphaerales bacterium]